MPRPATLPELQAHYGERYRWLLLLSVMVGTMASIMSSTIASVSLCGIVLEWRLAVHGDSLANPVSSPARLTAFNETFLMLASLCALALLAAWRIRAPSAAPPLLEKR